MLFVSVDDFFQKAHKATRLSRSDEKVLALRMIDGDVEARQSIINSYLPMVASYVKRSPKEYQSLKMIYSCVRSLEKGVDTFSFLQDSETFTHHLIWRLRQCITRCIVDRRQLRNILGKQGTAVPTRAKFLSPCRSRSLKTACLGNIPEPL